MERSLPLSSTTSYGERHLSGSTALGECHSALSGQTNLRALWPLELPFQIYLSSVSRDF